MQPARIAELLAPFLGNTGDQQLTAADLGHISMYIDILQRWNARINLTAIRDPEQIVTRHFGESFFAARNLFPREVHVGTAALGCPAERSSAGPPVQQKTPTTLAISHEQVPDERGRIVPPPATHSCIVGGRAALQSLPRACRGGRARDESEIGASAPAPSTRDEGPYPTLADVGSGAGFPGIPIKLWHPHLSLTLIESNHKKGTFLREIARALRLTDINIQSARAEALEPASFDVVTLRAVERFESILPVAARLVVPTGRLALLISEAQLPSAESILTQVHDFKANWLPPEPIPLSRTRVLAQAARST